MVTCRAQWKFVLEGSTIVGLFIFDRIAKWIAVHRPPAPSAYDAQTLREWLRGQMTLHYNPDIAFNIPLPKIIIVPAVLLLAVYLVSRLLKAIREKEWGLGVIILMPIVGAASNFMDRLQYGAVVDYIVFGGGFGFFNLADVLIMGGVALWALKAADGYRLK